MDKVLLHLKQEVFCLLLKLKAFSLTHLLSVVTNTNLHPPSSTFCVVPVKKFCCIWYKKKKKNEIEKNML